TDEILQILINAIGSVAQKPFSGIPFRDGDLNAYVGIVLGAYGASHLESVVSALSAALQDSQLLRAVDYAVALLRLVSPDAGGTFYGVDAAGLTPLQRRALGAVASAPGWRWGSSAFGNFGNAVASFGLPGSREKFRTYLGLHA